MDRNRKGVINDPPPAKKRLLAIEESDNENAEQMRNSINIDFDDDELLYNDDKFDLDTDSKSDQDSESDQEEIDELEFGGGDSKEDIFEKVANATGSVWLGTPIALNKFSVIEYSQELMNPLRSYEISTTRKEQFKRGHFSFTLGKAANMCGPSYNHKTFQLYAKSGYDKGHSVPAASFDSDALVKSTYVYANSSPMLPLVKSGNRLVIEDLIRKIVKTKPNWETIVCTGSLFDKTICARSGRLIHTAVETLGGLIAIPSTFYMTLKCTDDDGKTIVFSWIFAHTAMPLESVYNSFVEYRTLVRLVGSNPFPILENMKYIDGKAADIGLQVIEKIIAAVHRQNPKWGRVIEGYKSGVIIGTKCDTGKAADCMKIKRSEEQLFTIFKCDGNTKGACSSCVRECNQTPTVTKRKMGSPIDLETKCESEVSLSCYKVRSTMDLRFVWFENLKVCKNCFQTLSLRAAKEASGVSTNKPSIDLETECDAEVSPACYKIRSTMDVKFAWFEDRKVCHNCYRVLDRQNQHRMFFEKLFI